VVRFALSSTLPSLLFPPSRRDSSSLTSAMPAEAVARRACEGGDPEWADDGAMFARWPRNKLRSAPSARYAGNRAVAGVHLDVRALGLLLKIYIVPCTTDATTISDHQRCTFNKLSNRRVVPQLINCFCYIFFSHHISIF
jgi:hypothetical protein